jgi:ubiquinone/menaquinone biosynthesis C-methylase UbiE
VIKEISNCGYYKNSILEVGSGGNGIKFFINLEKWELYSTDIQSDVFNEIMKENVLISDGCHLPFKEGSFDIVITIDTAEHISYKKRSKYWAELKRVCKKKLIIICPLQSSDGFFKGRKYDIMFQTYHVRTKNRKEFNTEEHINSGHPTLNEIKSNLPFSIIKGYRNCNVWIKSMIFLSKPIIRKFTGLIYYLFWKKKDNSPPYWGGIIIWNKNS